MADGKITEARSESEPQVPPAGRSEPAVHVEFVDSLPGDRAVIAVEQDGVVTWLASRRHVQQKAAEDFLSEARRMVREGWAQNWSGTAS